MYYYYYYDADSLWQHLMKPLVMVKQSFALVVSLRNTTLNSFLRINKVSSFILLTLLYFVC